MSRTMIGLSAAALAALTVVVLPMAPAGDGDADDPVAEQAGTVHRGGWDRNGPDLTGMVDEGNTYYRGGWDGNGPDLNGMVDEGGTYYRGGWDHNGPDAAGGAALDLGRLTLQAIELPDGQVIDAATN